MGAFAIPFIAKALIGLAIGATAHFALAGAASAALIVLVVAAMYSIYNYFANEKRVKTITQSSVLEASKSVSDTEGYSSHDDSDGEEYTQTEVRRVDRDSTETGQNNNAAPLKAEYVDTSPVYDFTGILVEATSTGSNCSHRAHGGTTTTAAEDPRSLGQAEVTKTAGTPGETLTINS